MRMMLAAAVLFGAALSAGAQDAAPTTCVLAGRLIAEPGRPAQGASTILVNGGKIAAVVPGHTKDGCATVQDLSGYTVLPGLIDSHVHITSENGPTGRLDVVTKSTTNRAFDGAMYAKRTLEAGFTTVVDLGSEPEAIFALRDAIAAGQVAGPRIIAAGRAITPTGGHGDIQGYRPEVMAAFAGSNTCNGPDDCRRAVRAAVQGGADVIKITATGGVLSLIGAGLAQQLTDEELKAIVQTAHQLGRRVVAHAHGKDGIDAALRAGVDGIEHATYSDEASFKLYKASGAYMVPTVLAGQTVKEEAQKPGTWMVPPVRAKALEVADTMMDTLGKAKKAGVKVAFGTDTGVSKHGDNWKELALMVQVGFTPAEALRAATVEAATHARILKETGTIAAGKTADIIAVKGDPLADITVMKDVSFVMARGVTHKAP
jgi:imidazolonepropionase-like amidohydrolase